MPENSRRTRRRSSIINELKSMGVVTPYLIYVLLLGLRTLLAGVKSVIGLGKHEAAERAEDKWLS
jgi:hypothetical protein